jgi:signal transduction histidine kinase
MEAGLTFCEATRPSNGELKPFMSQNYLSFDETLGLLATLEAKAPPDLQADLAALRASLDGYSQRQSEFISHMVHEVRKPMTSIRGYADMLKVMGTLNDQQIQFLGTIRTNVLSMEALVSDISDISKLKSGRMKAEPKMEMFKNMSMQLEKDFKDLLEARQMTLDMEIPQGLPLLNLDSNRALQAIRKVVDNAIKYTHPGGKVTLIAAGEGNELVVHVKDHGVGISPQDQTHFGELFFRGDNELVTQTKGYGLGIPIALECLKLVGGSMTWQSTVGEGSHFQIRLPAMS